MGLFNRFRKQKSDTDLLILYGTKSGNSKLVALQAQKYLAKNGVRSACQNMSGYKAASLEKVSRLLVVVSTHGEGEPPPSAEAFLNGFLSESMINLRHLSYSVCGLGDSSYHEFCRAGKTIDKRLTELGATAFFPRTDCDLEFSEDAIGWIKQVGAKLYSKEKGESQPEFSATSLENKKVYTGKIVERKALTTETGVAPVFHIVLDIGASNIPYNIGDSLEFCPQNPVWLVDAIADEICKTDSNLNSSALKKQLRHAFEITSLSNKTIESYAQIAQNKALDILLLSEKDLHAYLGRANILDLISEYYSVDAVRNLPRILPKIKGRKYSIASSRKAFPHEIHLTIKTIRFRFKGNTHEGAASVFANEFLELNSNIDFELSAVDSFRLPENTQTPIILIGVSTGIAPFRAILQEREIMQTKGGTWLIWGNKYRQKDFLYENELLEYQNNGTLEKLDTAFSCNKDSSFNYIHEIITAKKAEITAWLNNGAHVYVCGSIEMGKSVKSALEAACAGTQHSPLNLIREKRWHEDVY